jgi:hypothetical protein
MRCLPHGAASADVVDLERRRDNSRQVHVPARLRRRAVAQDRIENARRRAVIRRRRIGDRRWRSA